MKTIRKIELKWSRVSLVRDECNVEYGAQIRHSSDTINIINALIGDEVHEVVIALQLNTKNRVVGYSEVSRGGMAGSAVTPADVFRPALIAGASKIIVAHNHPSGEPRPSTEDVVFTKRLREAGELLGVQVLDHIIVGDGSYFSFVDEGVF